LTKHELFVIIKKLNQNKKMNREIPPLDTESPYEIATAGRADPRSDFEIISDAIDPQLFDLYRKLGLLEARDNATFNRETVMDMIKEAWASGADFEKEHPGEVARLREEIIPSELTRAQANR
jgi:hypothetical protein